MASAITASIFRTGCASSPKKCRIRTRRRRACSRVGSLQRSAPLSGVRIFKAHVSPGTAKRNPRQIDNRGASGGVLSLLPYESACAKVANIHFGRAVDARRHAAQLALRPRDREETARDIKLT